MRRPPHIHMLPRPTTATPVNRNLNDTRVWTSMIEKQGAYAHQLPRQQPVFRLEARRRQPAFEYESLARAHHCLRHQTKAEMNTQ